MSTQATNTTRGSSWSDNEVKALIAIWGEGNIQEGTRWSWYERDWQQCRTKIKNLKKEYRQIKDHNGQTGRGRKICRYYKELDNILGHRPASAPAVLLDTGTSNNSSSDPQEDSTEDREEDVTNNGDDVQANSPMEGALIAAGLSSVTESGTNNNEPGDETATPPRKKHKVEKKTRAEKTMEKAIESFVNYQREAEERYQTYEDERLKKENELEERRRREDQEHEMRMMRMLGQMFQGGNYHSYTGQYDFDY